MSSKALSEHVYTVKVINRTKKSEFVMKALKSKSRFVSLADLISSIVEEIGPLEMDVVGYMKPGHGSKGKLQELDDDNDLKEMYMLHKRKREILLWCYKNESKQTCSKRSSSNEGSGGPPTKKDAIAKSISDVETIIVKVLQDTHGNLYSVEKYNAWAHLINIGKHDSYNEPPNYPFFTGNKKKNVTGNSGPSSSVDSPTKRLGFRTQCIEQLKSWHHLYECGAVTQDQYEKLKDSILGDIQDF